MCAGFRCFVCLFGLLGATAGAAEAFKPTLSVFILAGQSNMTGADSKADAKFPGREPVDQQALLWNRSEYGGKVWQHDHDFAPLRTQAAPGFGEQVIGPEFSFARCVMTAGVSHMAIVKVSYPASDLAVDWQKGATAGKRCYAAMEEELLEALTALRRRGENPRVAGILWCQGISDAHDSNGLKAADKAAAYAARLEAFIKQVRTDFAAADTPFVLARENASPARFVNADAMRQVRAASVAVAERVPHAAWIDVDGMERVNTHHFTAAAQMEIGRRYAAAWLRVNRDRCLHRRQ